MPTDVYLVRWQTFIGLPFVVDSRCLRTNVSEIATFSEVKYGCILLFIHCLSVLKNMCWWSICLIVIRGLWIAQGVDWWTIWLIDRWVHWWTKTINWWIKSVKTPFGHKSCVLLCVWFASAARELGVDMTSQDWKSLLETDRSRGGVRALPSPSPTNQSEVTKTRSIWIQIMCFMYFLAICFWFFEELRHVWFYKFDDFQGCVLSLLLGLKYPISLYTR